MDESIETLRRTSSGQRAWRSRRSTTVGVPCSSLPLVVCSTPSLLGMNLNDLKTVLSSARDRHIGAASSQAFRTKCSTDLWMCVHRFVDLGPQFCEPGFVVVNKYCFGVVVQMRLLYQIRFRTSSFIISYMLLDVIFFDVRYASGRYHLLYYIRFQTFSFITSCPLLDVIIYDIRLAFGCYFLLLYQMRFWTLSFMMLHLFPNVIVDYVTSVNHFRVLPWCVRVSVSTDLSFFLTAQKRLGQQSLVVWETKLYVV